LFLNKLDRFSGDTPDEDKSQSVTELQLGTELSTIEVGTPATKLGKNLLLWAPFWENATYLVSLTLPDLCAETDCAPFL
jgi:hypothetical protein